MKNWKTTLGGLVAGLPLLVNALIEAYNDGYFNEKKSWQLAFAIAIIVIGWILKDPIKNNAKSSIVGTRPSDR